MDEMHNQMHKAPIVNKANEDRIRAGETGHYVRYMVIVSCALVIVLFVAVAVFVES